LIAKASHVRVRYKNNSYFHKPHYILARCQRQQHMLFSKD